MSDHYAIFLLQSSRRELDIFRILYKTFMYRAFLQKIYIFN